MELTRVGLKAGRYEGLLHANGTVHPVIELVHDDRVIGHAKIAEDENGHHVTADIPQAVLSDGVQILLLRDAGDGTVLDRLTFLTGSALDSDFRDEMALMREELELLKRAFRRHCAETGTG